MLLLFTAVEIPYGLRPVYYGGMLMIFWTCYTGFFVPYSALGVEYTSDYNERTVLRSFASFFNMIGSMITMAVPTAFVELLTGRGMSVETPGLRREVFWRSHHDLHNDNSPGVRLQGSGL